MDSTRSILLALARIAEDTRLRWHVERAAVRARGQARTTGSEASVHHAVAERYLIEAIHAADLPMGFRVYDVALQRDPVAAAAQLRQIAGGFHPSGPIEREHEQARVAYRAGYEHPLTEPEHALARTLASIPPHRRDRIVDAVEREHHATGGLPVPGIRAPRAEASESTTEYTVVGVWEDDQPIPVGVIGGDHPVCGGDPQHWGAGPVGYRRGRTGPDYGRTRGHHRDAPHGSRAMTTSENRDLEVFHLLHWAWNVTEGHRLAATYPVQQADITVLAGFATLITVNPARLDMVDLTQPLLVVPVPELGNLVIDGWHRIHRALRDQLTHLPARQLTPADEQRIRIRPRPPS